jgi:hypothetical protein
MDFVVNEWLPEYFRPNAEHAEKALLEQFLVSFIQKEDKIFVRRPSPFLNKIHRFSKLYETDAKVYKNISDFIKLVLMDSNRCVFIDGNCALGDGITAKLSPGNFASDTYLFEAASKTNNKVIITTDTRLCNQMQDSDEYKVILLSDFLAGY